MAVKRGSLNKTLAGLIDLDDAVNHAWFLKRLIKQCKKQGCEVPEFSTLFEATPITDIKNNATQNNNNNSHKTKQFELDSEEKTPDEIAQAAASKEITATQRRFDNAKASDFENKAEISNLKLLELKRELIQINPLARLLFYILSAQRTQEINMMSNLSQIVLDDIKTALINDLPKEKKLTDAEIRVNIQDRWLKEHSKIYKNIDSELKNKIRQMKNKPNILEPKKVSEANNADSIS
jgi:hypothetical protein